MRSSVPALSSPPSRVQGAPAGGTACPTVLRNVGGAGAGGEQSIRAPRPNGCRSYDRAMTAHRLGYVRAVTALDRASQRSHPPLPSPPGRLACPCPRTRGKARQGGSIPSSPGYASPPSPSRVQGAQPPPGVQRVPRNAERRPHLSLEGGCREPNAPPGGAGGVPLYPKRLEGGAGGTTAQAKPDPPLKEGAGQNKTIRPHQRADAGVRGSCHIPIAKYELSVLWYPHEVGSRPASLSRSLPHTYCTGG